MELVAATFLRRGREQLYYRRAERECAVVLSRRLYVYVLCGYNVEYPCVSSHNTYMYDLCIILSATLFQVLCIPLRVLRVALLVCTARPFLS